MSDFYGVGENKALINIENTKVSVDTEEMLDFLLTLGDLGYNYTVLSPGDSLTFPIESALTQQWNVNDRIAGGKRYRFKIYYDGSSYPNLEIMNTDPPLDDSIFSVKLMASAEGGSYRCVVTNNTQHDLISVNYPLVLG